MDAKQPRFEVEDASPRDEAIHASRELNQRDKQARAGWKPPSALPPVPKPNGGLVYRWVRTQTRGQLDPGNLSKRFREGWTPVQAGEYPELMQQMPPQAETRFPGCIEIGSVVLMANSAEAMKQRKRYYAEQQSQQIQSLDNSMFKLEDRRRMPMFKERKSTVKVGKRPDVTEE